MHRGSERKGGSARRFKKRASKTERMNVAQPLRGGWRL